jgi:hypothetical protein
MEENIKRVSITLDSARDSPGHECTEGSQVLIAEDLTAKLALGAQAVSESWRQDFLLLGVHNPDFFCHQKFLCLLLFFFNQAIIIFCHCSFNLSLYFVLLL